MPRLTNQERIQIVTLYEAGYTQVQLAQQFNVHKRSVQRLLAKHRQHQTIEDLPRPGKRRVSTRQQDNALIQVSRENPQLVARQLRQRWQLEQGVRASTTTVKERLISAGLYGCVAKKKPLLSGRHRERRLAWARAHQRWTVNQWRRCFFSDESPVHLVMCRQRRYIRRQRGTGMRLEHLRPTIHSSGGKIDVWGGISYHGPHPLVRIQGRVNAHTYTDILRENLLPVNLPNRGMTFMHDNATPHTARMTRNFLNDHNIRLLDWPAQSPDMNPIENLWGIVKQEVDAIRVHGFQDLWNATLRVWRDIPPETIHKLIDSMPRRIQMVIAANGGPIRY